MKPKQKEEKIQYLGDTLPARKKQQGRTARLLRASIFVLVVLLVFLSFLALALPRFHVREVSVEGASFYDPAEVEALAGIHPGDAVLEIDLDERMGNILAKCRYLKSVAISVHLSGRVVIALEEEKNLMYTKRGEVYYSFSDGFKVIEQSDEPFSDFLFVELPDGVLLSPGYAAEFYGASAFAKDLLVPLVERLQNGAFAKNLTFVSVANEHEIFFILGENCKVILGENRALDEKEKALRAILDKEYSGRLPGEPKTFDLSDPAKISVR